MIYVIRNKTYAEIYSLQRKEFDKRVELRKEGRCLPDDALFLVEHYPVLTLGKHGNIQNLIVDKTVLNQQHIELVKIERGGDITYHGPGQLTVYPIIDLLRHNLGVKDYVWLLEQTVINVLSEYGISGIRVEGATGVWIKDRQGERKISAIGIKCSRHVSMHGVALNFGNDISGFNFINPCGFSDKGVTSISIETGCNIEFEDVAERFVRHFNALLQLRIPSQGNS